MSESFEEKMFWISGQKPMETLQNQSYLLAAEMAQAKQHYLIQYYSACMANTLRGTGCQIPNMKNMSDRWFLVAEIFPRQSDR